MQRIIIAVLLAALGLRGLVAPLLQQQHVDDRESHHQGGGDTGRYPAAPAGPPSPAKPGLPFPATVVIIPAESILRTAWLFVSAMYTFPSASTAGTRTGYSWPGTGSGGKTLMMPLSSKSGP